MTTKASKLPWTNDKSQPTPKVDWDWQDDDEIRPLAKQSEPEQPPARSVLESLIEGYDVNDKRQESLARAIELGASEATLTKLRDARRLARSATITLPAHRYESLSRGRGWARKGKGDSVEWGERVDGGYRVGPGRWTVGANDGFSRKAEVPWTVKHVAVGTETWTIAD